jgi:glycerol-3-phosphate dehydrogenase
MSPRMSSRRAIVYASTLVSASVVGIYAISSPRKKPSPDRQTYNLPRDENGSFILPKFPHIKTRNEQIADLRRHGATHSSRTRSSTTEEVYDLLIIGGGATGSGIALDAATRGLKVALIERDDFASGTSSRSTKLVHGGVRYLEKAVWNLDYDQYELVKEALRERSNFLNAAPHLTSWLPVMLPLQHWWQLPYFFAGTKCYDLLAGSEANPSSYFMPRRKAAEAFPMLKKSLVGALVYYDGQQNDSRMNVSLALTAALYGATTVNHLEVTALEKDANGRLCGARVRDVIPGEDDSTEPQEFLVHAKGIINATGPFADAIQQMDEPSARDIIAPSSGVHITLPAHFAPQNMGLLDPSTSDGRVLFMLPWQGTTLAGTTDAPCKISSNPQATERDIDWILKEVRKHLSPDVSLERRDVLAAWSGIRPLVRDPDAKNTESLVRSHLVSVSKSGLLTCAGGKWTTYRQMAEDAVDKAIEVFDLTPQAPATIPNISGFSHSHITSSLLDGTCQTQQIRLIGAHGYSPTLHINLIQHFHLEPDIATHLAQSYGDRAWEVAACASGDVNMRLSPQYPLIEAEIRYAVQREYAMTAIDVLARRTRLSFMDAKAALEALPKVVECMGQELGWSATRQEEEWMTTVRFLGTMGLEAGLTGITMEEVMEGKIGGEVGFVPRKKGRGVKEEVEVQQVVPGVAEVPVALSALEGEVV